MIKINLLPLEKRKAERTPLPRFGLIVTNVAVLCVLIVVFALSLLKVSSLRGDLETKKKELAALENDVKRFTELEAEEKKLSGEVENLRKVTRQRPVEWWRVCDAIWDVVQANPKIWLDSIELLDAKKAEGAMKTADTGGKLAASYGLILKCHAAGVDVANLTKFRMALKDNPVLKKYFPIANFNTSWDVSKQDEFVEAVSLDFDVTLINGTVVETKGKKK